MSGAVGSKPAFTRSGLPVWAERSSLVFSSSTRIVSSAPLLRYASCSSIVMSSRHHVGQLKLGQREDAGVTPDFAKKLLVGGHENSTGLQCQRQVIGIRRSVASQAVDAISAALCSVDHCIGCRSRSSPLKWSSASETAAGLSRRPMAKALAISQGKRSGARRTHWPRPYDSRSRKAFLTSDAPRWTYPHFDRPLEVSTT